MCGRANTNDRDGDVRPVPEARRVAITFLRILKGEGGVCFETVRERGVQELVYERDESWEHSNELNERRGDAWVCG